MGRGAGVIAEIPAVTGNRVLAHAARLVQACGRMAKQGMGLGATIGIALFAIAGCQGTTGAVDGAVPDGAVPDGVVADGAAVDAASSAASDFFDQAIPIICQKLAACAYIAASEIPSCQKNYADWLDGGPYTFDEAIAGQRLSLDPVAAASCLQEITSLACTLMRLPNAPSC